MCFILSVLNRVGIFITPSDFNELASSQNYASDISFCFSLHYIKIIVVFFLMEIRR